MSICMKTLQKSSIIQNISVTLSSIVITSVDGMECFFDKTKPQPFLPIDSFTNHNPLSRSYSTTTYKT